MSTVEDEIAEAKKLLRQHLAAGRDDEAAIIAGMLYGLNRARDLILGEEIRPACKHFRHTQIAVDGKPKWVCRQCGEPAK